MRAAHRRSFQEMPETCPDLDDFIADVEDYIGKQVNVRLADLAQDIKSKITMPFRDALNTAYAEVEEQESRADDLERENDNLKDDIRRLESEIEDLKREVERLERESA